MNWAQKFKKMQGLSATALIVNPQILGKANQSVRTRSSRLITDISTVMHFLKTWHLPHGSPVLFCSQPLYPQYIPIYGQLRLITRVSSFSPMISNYIPMIPLFLMGSITIFHHVPWFNPHFELFLMLKQHHFPITGTPQHKIPRHEQNAGPALSGGICLALQGGPEQGRSNRFGRVPKATGNDGLINI